jgi:hypothetical protein
MMCFCIFSSNLNSYSLNCWFYDTHSNFPAISRQIVCSAPPVAELQSSWAHLSIIFPYFSMMCLLSREKAKNRNESTVYHTGNNHPNYYTTKTLNSYSLNCWFYDTHSNFPAISRQIVCSAPPVAGNHVKLVSTFSEHFHNSKNCRKEKMDTPNTQIHDRSLFWLGTDTSIKSCGVRFE